MPRVLSLFLPWWQTERIARRAVARRADAILLVRLDHGQQAIAHLCPRAHRAGVRSGMNLAQARTLLAGCDLHIENDDPTAQAASLQALARWAARRWSPVVSVDATDGLLLEIAGCEHVFGDEARHVAAIEQGVRALGLTSRIGVAGTVGAAWAVARFASPRGRLTPPGREREAIAPLPTSALRIDPEVIEALAEVGIDRVGQLLDVPRHMLPARYGSDLLGRLDQALGHLPETLERTAQAPTASAARELPGGTTHLESVQAIVCVLLEELCAVLARQESGLCALDAVFDRLGTQPQRLDIRVSRATRDPRHLWSLLRPKVERLQMGLGVERVALRVMAAARLTHHQAMIGPEQDSAWQHDAEFASLLDTLVSRLGPARVLRPQLIPSHRPERTYRLVPIDETARANASPPLAGPRPSRLFHPPSPAEAVALTPDGPVLRLRWGPEEHRVLSCIGPEKIGPEWWREREPTREYFRVQNDHGRWLWLFRETDSRRWFVHGEWN